jgi:hypothetical protein
LRQSIPHRSAWAELKGKEDSPKGQAPDFIAFAVAIFYFSPLSAQKSHVKSQNHLNR